MDGACGLCLVAMLVRGQLRRRRARSLERVDSHQSLRAPDEALDQHGPLLRRPAPPASTCWSCWPRSTIPSISPSGARGAGWSGTREYLEAGFPVVLGFHGRKGSDIRHWGLAIGMSERAFLLDPAHDLLRAGRPGERGDDHQQGARFPVRLSAISMPRAPGR